MGFLKDSNGNQSIYLDIKQEPTLVRPLALKPQSVWTHKVQEVTTVGADGKPAIVRKFSYETCTANNRTGSGCFLCSTPDPLWHMLKTDEQTNRQGKRVDFPKTPIHLMPVFNHTTNQVEVMKGGNQPFEEMDKWYDAQPDSMKDLRRCDWRVWKTGVKKTTKYQSVRLDATAFEITPELEAQAKNVLASALRDRNPTEPTKLAATIRGGSELPELAAPAAVPALPPVAPMFTSAPQTVTQPVTQPVSLPTVQQTKTAVHVEAAPGQQAPKTVLAEFSGWLQQQPEFQGMAIVSTLLPMLKDIIGHADYNKLDANQIANLRTALQSKLDELRAKRS